VFFIDDNTGWMVGSDGFITKTTNAGIDWIEQTSGITTYLKSVKFVDENIGWAVGESGLILKTTDGGLNWSPQNSGTEEILDCIFFYNANLGWASGYGGVVLKTTDSGVNWTSLVIDTSYVLSSVYFVDENVGWVVGKKKVPEPTEPDRDSAMILKTNDGGESWISQPYPPLPLFDDYYSRFYAVQFMDANNGWTVGGTGYGSEGQYFILNTTNGGIDWTLKFGGSPNNLRGKITSPGWYDELPGFRSVHFKDSMNGVAVGSSTDTWENIIVSTTDGGNTWVYKYGFWEWGHMLYSVFVTNSGNGCAVGERGFMVVSNDNGNTWKERLSGTNYNINAQFFINENEGWICGSRTHTIPYIMHTTNSGEIWVTQYLGDYQSPAFDNIFFYNALIGWAVNVDDGYMLKTTNGGNDWFYSGGFGGSSIFFIDENLGWGASNSYDSGIFKTTDGGTTWTNKDDHSSSSVYFANNNIGWAVGPGGIILKSTDGGETWVPKTSGTTENLTAIKFYNSNTGMCVGRGGTVLLSTDGGETWTLKNCGTLENLNSISFSNSTTAWVSGTNGIILSTTDLGDNWTSYDGLTSNNLSSINFVNENNGWVSGFGGTMFKYSTEPIPPTNHFTPIWSENPYTPMNIYVTSATVDGADLVAGDEIGVYDGDNCVGSVVLTEAIPSGGFASIIASTDDPTTAEVDGFIPGHSITYKLWSASNSREITRVTPSYSLGNGTFSAQGSAVVGLTSIYTVTQQVTQTTGWNILSLMSTPENPDMLQLLNPLITAGTLVKVQDERGFAVEQLPVIGWINNIGNWQSTEGYYMRVNAPSTLSVEGLPVALPLNIPLTNGWNIIGYPVPTEQNALTVLNPLIAANQLVKVQNEAGQAVEQLPVIGWINNIGNLRAGEGYYLKVNTNTSLTLSDPGDSPVKVLTANEEELKQKNLNKPNADHFVLVYSSPYLPMNIYVTAVSLSGGGTLGAGDEIGIFDGDYCVGSFTLTDPIGSFISLIASTDDPGAAGIDGFTPGHTISYKFWLAATSTEVTDYNVEYSVGDGIFVSQGTAVISFEGVLPVELTSFTAALNKNEVNLKWQTATETNNYGFEIERKTESSWQKIGFVEGNGTSNSTKEYSFADNKLVGGTKFQYRLKQIDSDGKYEYSKVIEVENIPTEYALYQNYPNPFNPTTKMRYQLPVGSKVVIKIYNILGSEVMELVNEQKESGVYEIEFNAETLSSGTYIYRIVTGNFVQTKKMILLK